MKLLSQAYRVRFELLEIKDKNKTVEVIIKYEGGPMINIMGIRCGIIYSKEQYNELLELTLKALNTKTIIGEKVLFDPSTFWMEFIDLKDEK